MLQYFNMQTMLQYFKWELTKAEVTANRASSFQEQVQLLYMTMVCKVPFGYNYHLLMLWIQEDLKLHLGSQWGSATHPRINVENL